MIVLDVNILLYAYNDAATQHHAARKWLTSIFNGQELIGLPWLTLSAFLRISTSRRIFPNALSMEDAIGFAQQWLAVPHVRLLAPGELYWSHLQRAIREGHVSGPDTTDAELAALATEKGGVLHTTDRDFARFPGLRWVNPLEKS